MRTNFAFALYIIRFSHRLNVKMRATHMATTYIEDGQQLDANRQHKIPWIDIELKEKQFMNDELEYYKEVKTKSKKNAHAEAKNPRFFR